MPVTPVRPPPTWNTDSSQILHPKERQDKWVFGVLPLLVISYIVIVSYGFYLLYFLGQLPDATGLIVAMSSTIAVAVVIWLVYRLMSPNVLIIISLTIMPLLMLALAFTVAFLVDKDFGNAFILVCIVCLNAFKYAGLYAGEYRVPTAFVMHVVHKSSFSMALIPFAFAFLQIIVMFFALAGLSQCPIEWLKDTFIYTGIFLEIVILFILASYTRMRSSAATIRQCLTLPRTTNESHRFIFTTYLTYFTIDGFLRSLPLLVFLLLVLKARLGALITIIPDIQAGMSALLRNESYFQDFSCSSIFFTKIGLGESQVYDVIFYITAVASLTVQLLFHLLGWTWVTHSMYLTISWVLMQVLVAPIVSRIPSAVRTYQHDNRSFLLKINDDALATEIATNIRPQAE